MSFRALVADDDEDLRLIISSTLRAIGAEVVECRDGQQAESYCDEVFDIVVLDYVMPGKSGVEVCQAFKQRQGENYTPVMLLTARDHPSDKVSALDSGVDDYLVKPFNHHELQARVRALLRVRQAARTLRDKNEELKSLQQKLIEQERANILFELAATAAHKLGQPLSAILLNSYLLKTLTADDPRFEQTRAAIESDASRMVEIVEKLRAARSDQVDQYQPGMKVFSIK